MPYPEGEVYFKRSTLGGAGFNPDDLADFTSHILEYTYNRPVYIGGHYRYYESFAMRGDYKGYFPSSINVMFTHKAGGQIKRRVRTDPCPNAGDYQASENAGVDKVLIRPIRLRLEEKFMFIDMVVPIRATYLSLAQRFTMRSLPDLCAYLMVDFCFWKGVWMDFTPSGIVDADLLLGRSGQSMAAASDALLRDEGKSKEDNGVNDTLPPPGLTWLLGGLCPTSGSCILLHAGV